MKTNIRALVVLSLLFALNSCQFSSENWQDATKVIVEEKNEIDVLSIYKDYEIIELKGGPLIGQISQVAFHAGKFYLVDVVSQHINVFDNSLNFLFTVNHAGLGPGEYRTMDHFFVNDQGMYVYSNFQRSVLHYSLKGDFIDEIKLNDYPYSVMDVGNRIVSYLNFSPSSQQNYNFELFDLQGKSIKKAQPFQVYLNEMIGYAGGFSELTEDQNRVHYNPPLSDSILVYNEELEIERLYLISDLVKNPLPDGIYNSSFNVGTRNTHGYIASLTKSFGSYVWMEYKEPPYLKSALVDFDKGVFYRWDNITSKGFKFLLSNVQCQDDNGYYYSRLSQFIPKDADVIKEFAEKTGFSSEKLGTEDFDFLVRFKLAD